MQRFLWRGQEYERPDRLMSYTVGEIRFIQRLIGSKDVNKLSFADQLAAVYWLAIRRKDKTLAPTWDMTNDWSLEDDFVNIWDDHPFSAHPDSAMLCVDCGERETERWHVVIDSDDDSENPTVLPAQPGE
jgi:hypothetical protein